MQWQKAAVNWESQKYTTKQCKNILLAYIRHSITFSLIFISCLLPRIHQLSKMNTMENYHHKYWNSRNVFQLLFLSAFFFFFKLCTSTNSNIINHKFILVYSFVHLSIYFRWHRIKVWFTFLPTTKKVKTKINKILSCLYIRWNSSVCIALKQTKKKVHFLQQKTNVGCKLIIDENTNSQILISWSYVNLIFPTLIDKKFCHHFHCTLRVLRH